jgi:hypothetical protein
MNNTTKNETFYIFSPCLYTATKRENWEREVELEGILDEANVGYKKVMGRYKGVDEISFLVVGEGRSDMVTTLADGFGQASYLKVDPDRNATLVSKAGAIDIGKWTEFKGDITTLSAYTVDTTTGLAYHCVKGKK